MWGLAEFLRFFLLFLRVMLFLSHISFSSVVQFTLIILVSFHIFTVSCDPSMSLRYQSIFAGSIYCYTANRLGMLIYYWLLDYGIFLIVPFFDFQKSIIVTENCTRWRRPVCKTLCLAVSIQDRLWLANGRTMMHILCNSCHKFA